MQRVLGVVPGSVTPFALINVPSAAASALCSMPRCWGSTRSTITRWSIPRPRLFLRATCCDFSPIAGTRRRFSRSPVSTARRVEAECLPAAGSGRHVLGGNIRGKPLHGTDSSAAPPAPADTASLVKNGSTASFMADVIDASHDAAVVVDFWAPWCGPCKQLGPALEKAVRDARGTVRLVKINIDENPELAQQMRIQSIPAVYAFKDGRPVDGFVGALPESQVKQFVGAAGRRRRRARRRSPRRWRWPRRPSPPATTRAPPTSMSQMLQHEPGNAEAIAGLARIAIAPQGIRQGASSSSTACRRKRRTMPRSRRHAPRWNSPRPASKAAGAVGELRGAARARPQGPPGALRSRRRRCSPPASASRRSTSCSSCVRRDREWNEQAARKQLLKFFEAIGLADPLTVAARQAALLDPVLMSAPLARLSPICRRACRSFP